MRWLLWIVDGFPYVIPGLTGFIVALTTAGHRRVGDMAAKTFVVKRAAAGTPIRSCDAASSSSARRPPSGGARAGRHRRPHPARPPAGARPSIRAGRLGQPGPARAAAARRPARALAATEGPQWDEARGTYIQWDPAQARVDAVGRGLQGLVPHPRPVARACPTPSIPTGSRTRPRGSPARPTSGPTGFFALDLRVGRVVDVEAFPEARKPAWKLTVDFGPVIGVLRTSAQITNYAADELRGRLVVGAINLGTKRIAGFTSEFLVLGALDPDGTVRLLQLEDGVAPGAPVA